MTRMVTIECDVKQRRLVAVVDVKSRPPSTDKKSILI